MFSLTVQKFGSLDVIDRQVKFATAVALTKTAQKAQKAVTEALKTNFTLRGNWYEAKNKFGIRIKPATRDNLTSSVTTLADWLKLHETGGDKLPSHKLIAVPTDNVRRNKKLIIPKAQRPAALRLKGAFVLQTKAGPVVFQRKGKGKRAKLVPLYILEPKVKIKKQPSFYVPIEKSVRANFQKIWNEEMKSVFSKQQFSKTLALFGG